MPKWVVYTTQGRTYQRSDAFKTRHDSASPALAVNLGVAWSGKPCDAAGLAPSGNPCDNAGLAPLGKPCGADGLAVPVEGLAMVTCCSRLFLRPVGR